MSHSSSASEELIGDAPASRYEQILDASLSPMSPEHGAAWEMLLLLRGMYGPSEFFKDEAAKRGLILQRWEEKV